MFGVTGSQSVKISFGQQTLLAEVLYGHTLVPYVHGFASRVNERFPRRFAFPRKLHPQNAVPAAAEFEAKRHTLEPNYKFPL